VHAADLNPLVLAISGLVIALTPVAVTYLTVQVELIKRGLADRDTALALHRAEVNAKLDLIAASSTKAADASTVAASHTERRQS
jgi:hypothetical protein